METIETNNLNLDIKSDPYVFGVTPKTVYLMVGPPNCGKSYFCKNIASAIESFNLGKVAILSSDENRRYYLRDAARSKLASEMMRVSEGAFNKLFFDLEQMMRFPVSLDYICVDTTGMNKEFRDQVLKLVKSYNYRIEMVLFNYDKVSDYYQLKGTEGFSRELTSRFVTKLRQQVLKDLDRSSYDAVHKIRTISDPVVVPNGRSSSYRHESNITTFVVGDVHNCYTELLTLLEKVGIEVTDGLITNFNDKSNEVRHLVMVGDLIDKGPDLKQVLHFALKNLIAHPNRFHTVACNHGNYVFKYLKGLLKDTDPNLLNYFDSIRTLELDSELRQVFFDVWNMTSPYYRNQKVIVTHAPCENKYLEKSTEVAFKAMRNFRYSGLREITNPVELEDSVNSTFEFLKKDANSNHPYHVFGHISFTKPFKYKNKIGIDTGCYAGNTMSMVEIPHNQDRVFFNSVPSVQPKLEDKLYPPPVFDNTINFDELEVPEKKRINFLARNKVNYVSGTVSPANKDESKNILESLEQGLLYYKNHGVGKVILQPKYMGSRCNMYLYFKEGQEVDLERSFLVSRNGYKIRQLPEEVTHKLILSTWENSLKANAQLAELQHPLSLIILDGELLPWAVLGKGLIDENFKPISWAVSTETELLASTGFEEAYLGLANNSLAEEFYKDKKTFPKKKLVEKYTNHTYQCFNAIEGLDLPSVEEERSLIKAYTAELENYTKDTEVTFKPFDILKVEMGSFTLTELDSSVFEFINKDTCHVVDFSAEDWLTPAQTFFDNIVESKMEGVVIKPLDRSQWSFINVKKEVPRVPQVPVAPYMKVRSPSYLTLIYGYDYLRQSKYSKLLKQKSITKKLQVSIKEHKLGLRMLGIENSKISMDNLEYMNLAAKLVLEERMEKTLDPRL